MDEGLMETAKIIASKSPIAIHTLKHVNVHELKRKFGDGLDRMGRINTSALLTKDMMTAIGAWMNKETPVFPKL